MTEELDKAPIDLALIGIGENAHIAFNDPPADFDDKRAYKIVNLDEKCRLQQVREGWFKGLDDVCRQAVSMTCSRIMQSEKIISVVPHAVKAEAVFKTLSSEVNPLVPATLLKKHKNFTLYCDKNSISQTPSELIKKFSA